MPTKIGERIASALLDRRIETPEVDALIETAKAEKKWTAELKAEVVALLQTDTFASPADKAKLAAFVDTTPTVKDLADPTILTKHAGTLEWNPVASGKLFVDGVSNDDVIQGSIANCYMVAAFSSIAQADPKAIENAIKDNGDGTYDVRFFESNGYGRPMKEVKVTVDGDMPMLAGASVGKYAKGRDKSELWVGVLEKAYAQWKGGYEAVGNGGRSTEVFTAITGKSTSQSMTSYTPADQLFTSIQTATAAHKPVTAGTHGKDSGVDYNGTGVYAWHAYSVMGAVEEGGQKYVQLRNPWGSSEHGSDGKDDGMFKMKLEDFTKLYSNVSIGQ
ncbi:MAG: peptidase calpain [Myxococcaceae bacterium]|nr:peptidase calpain [Myxococcaceae bacterium]